MKFKIALGFKRIAKPLKGIRKRFYKSANHFRKFICSNVKIMSLKLVNSHYYIEMTFP